MLKETSRDRLVRLRYWAATTLLFLMACTTTAQPTRAITTVPPQTMAMNTPSPALTLPPTMRTPFPALTPSPISTHNAMNPLQQALVALSQESSVRIRTSYSETSATGSTALVETIDMLYRPGPPEQIQSHYDWGSGMAEDLICLGSQQREHCWSHIGQHPWTLRADLEPVSLTWLEQRQRELAATTIISSETLPVSNQIVVAWRPPLPPGADPAQFTQVGRTWLQADTYLPIQEIVEGQLTKGQPISHWAALYSDYNAAVTIQAPAVATVTPIPTIPATPLSPGVVKPTHVEALPFPGVLIVPGQQGPFPAVLVLHGSDGSLLYTGEVAQQLARSGFVALAMCYFGCPQTPHTLNDIPVEGVKQAVDYLKSRKDVRSDAVALVGYSRGAELALIVGVLDPDVHAVVSVMGAPWVVGGFPSGGTAWLYQGQPLPFRNIPVQQINGPVLVMHGERDMLWPVGFSYLIADRLAAHGHPYELAIYPDRGHDIGLSPLDAYDRIVDFLRRTLR